jgi:hypothetical protein
LLLKTEAMKQLFIIWIIFGLAAPVVFAQEPSAPYYLRRIIIDNDTLPHKDLPQVDIYAKSRFKPTHDDQQFWRMVTKVKKVFPYAKEAARLYQKYQKDIPKAATRRERRVYVKKAEDELMELYGPKLKQMTISEGRILIKLIDRETHTTSYDLIDQVKGGVPAFFWQGVARIFGNNLKSHYDPYGEDHQIEQIINYIEAGII